MEKTRTNLRNDERRLWKKALGAISTAALLAAMILGSSASAAAQFTFTGDYDKTFAAPNGYYADVEEPDPTVNAFQTYFNTGALLGDGSIVAGGRFVTTNVSGDFYVRKFTAAGAVDTSFGTNGAVRTNFFADNNGVPSNETPYVLKVQPDGKILFAGDCRGIRSQSVETTPSFGEDACVVRYNPNGTLDTSFGGFTVFSTGQGTTAHAIPIEPGKLTLQTGVINSGQKFGTSGAFYDMAIQPDGKILLVGETRNYDSFFVAQGYGAIIVRLNANGSLDASFGAGGIARWTAPQTGTCFPERRFFGVRLQADGRIIAVGHDGLSSAESCSPGRFFAVTRWTANGQLETVRRLDANTDTGQDERAVTAHFTRDGSKILVSGSYRNLSGTPAGRNKPTMARLNVGDLSLDTSFGSGGIVQYNVTGNSWSSTTLSVKAIQPDGKIIGSDDAFVFNSNGVVRFNPDGSPDKSFGNLGIDSSGVGLGRLRLFVTDGGTTNIFERNPHILVRPNGRLNLLGAAAAFNGYRAVASQQNTNFQNGSYADFENDGKDNLAVYRPAEGVWHNLDSQNNNYSAVQWGISSDKLAPADYDGDGKTDRAVFRDGTWYISQSASGQARILNFGLAGDLPRPGDFDGDGLADISVFRPSSGVWYRLNSSNGAFAAIQFGASGDVPMLGDYDGDGRTDFAVFRPSNSVWYVFRSSDNQVQVDAFGTGGDIPLNGDFNGDSRADLAVFRPSNRTWYIARPSGAPGQNYDATQFGLAADVPVAADYDNDGKTDLAIYRNGSWWILRSGTSDVINTQFGLSSDKPISAAYLP
jgi:uncharacterized delta-60 repeat protein